MFNTANTRKQYRDIIKEGSLYYYEGTEVIKLTRIVKDEINGVVVYSMNDIVDLMTPKTYTWYTTDRFTTDFDTAIENCIKRRIKSAVQTIERCEKDIKRE